MRAPAAAAPMCRAELTLAVCVRRKRAAKKQSDKFGSGKNKMKKEDETKLVRSPVHCATVSLSLP